MDLPISVRLATLFEPWADQIFAATPEECRGPEIAPACEIHIIRFQPGPSQVPAKSQPVENQRHLDFSVFFWIQPQNSGFSHQIWDSAINFWIFFLQSGFLFFWLDFRLFVFCFLVSADAKSSNLQSEH